MYVAYYGDSFYYSSDLPLTIYNYPVRIDDIYKSETYIRVGYVLEFEDFGTGTYYEVEIPLDQLDA